MDNNSKIFSVNQNLEAKRIRARLFKDLDLKLKYHKKNFQSTNNHMQILHNGSEDMDDKLPKYMKGLSSMVKSNSSRNFNTARKSIGVVTQIMTKKLDNSQTRSTNILPQILMKNKL